jgi:hypothetical protein
MSRGAGVSAEGIRSASAASILARNKEAEGIRVYSLYIRPSWPDTAIIKMHKLRCKWFYLYTNNGSSIREKTSLAPPKFTMTDSPFILYDDSYVSWTAEPIA